MPSTAYRIRFDQLDTDVSTESNIYARPDVYDMEYEGASNDDARFFARLLARVRPRRVLEMACGSGRVTFTLAAGVGTTSAAKSSFEAGDVAIVGGCDEGFK